MGDSAGCAGRDAPVRRNTYDDFSLRCCFAATRPSHAPRHPQPRPARSRPPPAPARAWCWPAPARARRASSRTRSRGCCRPATSRGRSPPSPSPTRRRRRCASAPAALVGARAAKHLVVSTFHSLGVRLLRADGTRAGPEGAVLDPRRDDVLGVLKDAGATTDNALARRWQWTISRWKNDGPDAGAGRRAGRRRRRARRRAHHGSATRSAWPPTRRRLRRPDRRCR